MLKVGFQLCAECKIAFNSFFVVYLNCYYFKSGGKRGDAAFIGLTLTWLVFHSGSLPVGKEGWTPAKRKYGILGQEDESGSN